MYSVSLPIRAQAELELRRRGSGSALIAPDNWREWLAALFPQYVSAPMAPRHIAHWEWIDGLVSGVRPVPLAEIWPRGGAKSTSAELGVVRVGARQTRRYVWYVSGTQDKADNHVENIGAMLESPGVEKYYPDLSSRAVTKYGSSRGWRRSRMHTRSGYTVDSLGLDTGSRGVKIEEQRPDLIILDDVDELHDSFATTQKKIETITKSVLPAGSGDCAVLFIQNKIHPESIASRLSDGRADFLLDRQLSGPFSAIDNLVYEQRDGRFYIVSGEATWGGQSLEVCQQQINTWGLSAFLQEAQHEVEHTGGIWDHIEFQHIEWDKLPAFTDISVWVDPAVTSTDQSDCQGISAGGVSLDKKLYGLYWWEGITSPENALERAIRKGYELGASRVGVETDQGGDTWQSVYHLACDKIIKEITKNWQQHNQGKEIKEMPEIRLPGFASDKAGAGYGSKVERNARMLTSYEHGNVFHAIGTQSVIEKSLRRFPNKPLDLADSWYWVWQDLLGTPSQIFI